MFRFAAINKTVITAATSSAATTESQIPSISKKAGRINTAATWNTRLRRKEIRAEENKADDRGDNAADDGAVDEQREEPLGLFPIVFPHGFGDQGAASRPEHEADGAQYHQDRHDEVDGGKGRFAHKVGHEEAVHHFDADVEVMDRLMEMLIHARAIMRRLPDRGGGRRKREFPMGLSGGAPFTAPASSHNQNLHGGAPVLRRHGG